MRQGTPALTQLYHEDGPELLTTSVRVYRVIAGVVKNYGGTNTLAPYRAVPARPDRWVHYRLYETEYWQMHWCLLLCTLEADTHLQHESS